MSKQEMSVTVERPPALVPSRTDTAVIKVSGELGIAAMMEGGHTGADGDTALANALRQAVPNPPPLVVVDLSSVTFLSSLGIGTVLRFQQWLQQRGSDLRVVGAADMVTLLRRCRLDQVLSLFSDVPSAVGS